MGDEVRINTGSVSVQGKYFSFEEARAIARSLNVKTRKTVSQNLEIKNFGFEV